MSGCQAQQSKPGLHISDVKFKSYFGYTATDPGSGYCLLGSGFFKTPSSDNSDSLIASWIKAHPNAMIVPVSSFGPVASSNKNSKMIYCWIIDKTDTLNNYLVRKGCFPGGTMIRPKTWKEMSKRERDIYIDLDEKPEVTVYIDKSSYDTFIEQITVAEAYAQKHKLGIWAKKETY